MSRRCPPPLAGAILATAISTAAIPAATTRGAEAAPDPAATTKDEGTAPASCGRAGCTSCSRQVPVCTPKWKDKTTKRPLFSMACEPECVRPWEPYCQGPCCEEKTTPCGTLKTRKRLYKEVEEHKERVLTYEVDWKPAPPCCPPPPACDCLGCRCLGRTVGRLFHW